MLKKILFGGETGNSPLTNLGLTILRVFAGASMAFAHGLGKIPPSEKFIAGVEKLGFPFPAFFAWSACLSEFAGGILLALGLLTRVAGFFIASTMTVAVLGVHLYDPFGKKELALLYLMVAVLFMLRGAGDWSLDSIFRKRK